MSPASLSITFHLEIFGRHVTLSRDAAASESLETVALKLLRSTGIGDSLDGWEILREEGEQLSFSQKVGDLVRDRWSGNISVTLRLAMQMPGKGPGTPGDGSADPGGPRLPKPRGAAPITRHEIHLPNVNDVTGAGDADTDLEEGAPPPLEKKKAAAGANGQTAAKPPAGGAKPASKPMMAPPKPGAAPAKPASKPMMAPPKPAAGAAPAKPASKPMMAPPKPGAPATGAAPAKPPSKPMMAPAKPASKPLMAPAKPPSKPMMAPQTTPPAAPAANSEPPAPPKADSKKRDGLIATEFDIPPMEEPTSSVVAVNQVKDDSRAPSRDKTEADFDLDLDDSQQAAQAESDEYSTAKTTAPARSRKKAKNDPYSTAKFDAPELALSGDRIGQAPKRTAERQATARYYSRMNPQRVFPLLVVISKEMIERQTRSDAAQQTSGPFKVALDSAIEIEPVLPGCYCYPPKATARLGSDDLTIVFHVVPHVLGEVTGACIKVRQDHYDLATIDLDVKVVQRTWVMLSGALTLSLPFMAALARHLRFDVGSRSEDVLLLAMSAVVNHVPPYALMGGLAVATLLAYWLTRARRKDAFFDVTPIGADEKLRQISARLESDPAAAADDLVYLLKAHPEHLAARLVFADCHFRLGNYSDALSAYQFAFAKGKTEDRHYIQAAQAAAKAGDWVGGSKILAAADEALTRERTGQADFDELRNQLRGAARSTL